MTEIKNRLYIIYFFIIYFFSAYNYILFFFSSITTRSRRIVRVTGLGKKIFIDCKTRELTVPLIFRDERKSFWRKTAFDDNKIDCLYINRLSTLEKKKKKEKKIEKLSCFDRSSRTKLVIYYGGIEHQDLNIFFSIFFFFFFLRLWIMIFHHQFFDYYAFLIKQLLVKIIDF